jgi:DNA polymerase III delta subunit
VFDFRASRLHAAVSPSIRLRDRLVAEALAGWDGPVKRAVDPEGVDRLVLDLDTPSLFDPPGLWLVRCDERWVKRHRERLLPLAGTPSTHGAVVLVATALEGGEDRAKPLTRALEKAQALHRAEVPGDKEVASWLLGWLGELPLAVEHPAQVAETLIERVGADVDALLAVLEVAVAHAGDGPLRPADITAVAPGLAAKPVWDFTGALIEGNAKRAIELLHAGGGMDPAPALAAVLNELRKLLACSETKDDAAVAGWAGLRGRPNLFYARRRADQVGRANLLRIYRAALHAQTHLRSSGTDHELALETLVLHAQRIVRPMGR